MSIPYRLQEGTNWEDAISLINTNFNYYIGDVNAFGLVGAGVSPFAGFAAGFTLGAGSSLNQASAVWGESSNSKLAGITNMFSIYIDLPDLFTRNETLRWPTGSALTAAQKNIWFSFFMSVDKFINTPGQAVTTADANGVVSTWYYYGDVYMFAANKDSGSHKVSIFYDYSLLSTPNPSVFR